MTPPTPEKEVESTEPPRKKRRIELQQVDDDSDVKPTLNLKEILSKKANLKKVDERKRRSETANTLKKLQKEVIKDNPDGSFSHEIILKKTLKHLKGTSPKSDFTGFSQDESFSSVEERSFIPKKSKKMFSERNRRRKNTKLFEKIQTELDAQGYSRSIRFSKEKIAKAALDCIRNNNSSLLLFQTPSVPAKTLQHDSDTRGRKRKFGF